MLDTVNSWLGKLHGFGWTLGVGLAVSAVTVVAGMAAIVLLPADFFVRGREARGFLRLHPVLRFTLIAGKNVLGGIVVVLGLVLSLPLVPGPGFLFLLVGLGLVDFPGKRAFELRLVRLPRVLSSFNRLRARYGRPPIQVPEETDRGSSRGVPGPGEV